MIDNKWLRMCGNPPLATAIFLLSSACFVNGIGAQSVESVEAGSYPSPVAHPTFLVAPSISLGYAPTSVATGDLRRSGKLDLITADCQSGNISVFLGAGQGKFGAGTKYAAGPCPSSVIVADINGDGRPDVLVSNESKGTIGVLFGNGDGSLQPLKSYSVGFQPAFIAAGEFDGSGKVDVAVAGASGNHLAILLNDGSGNLQKPVAIPISKAPTALTVADFNNDGHSDLALANADGTVTILLGQGGVVFHALPDIGVGSQALSSIASADFNKDGKIDLAVTQPGQKLVSVLVGKGDGTFAPPASYPVGNEAVSTLVADVDGDGIPDLVVINKLSNTFSVLGGNGDGTFKASLDFVAGNAPLAAVAGDFYGNGHADLAIINHSSQTVSVPPGNGDGTFKASRSYEAGQQPVSIASGNLNGAKLRGLVVANYCGSEPDCGSGGNVAVFLADDKGDYKLSSTYAVGAGPVSVALADVNGDKKLDIIALNRLDKTVSVLLGVGDGTFQRQITIPLEAAPIAVGIGDFNKDGNPDLAVLEDCGTAKCSQPGSLEILAGKRDGNFQSVSSYPVGYSPSSLAIGDINADKALDILVANRCGKDASCASPGTATVLIGDGTGKFTPGTDLALGNSPSSIALGNLSGSNLDLLVSRSTDNTVAVLRGNGDGTFKAAVPYAVGAQPGPLAVADFNGDGIADVAVTNFKDSTVSLLFGKGDGTLQPSTDLPVGAGPVALTAIGAAKSKYASLATANGNSGSSTPGTDITALQNLLSDPPLASFKLVPSPTSSSVNDMVKLTATLTGVSPNAAPVGTVTFQSNSADLSDCTDVDIVQGVSPSLVSTATCTTQMLQGGSDSLTAVYSGDDVYDPGVGETSAAVMQPVAALSPILDFTSPASPTTAGTSVTFTVQLDDATLTPITPVSSATPGTVSFTLNGTVVPNCLTVPISATGSASCDSPPLVAGTAKMIADYSGDNNFNTASKEDDETVSTGGVASATPTSSLPTSSVNQTVTFTVAVTNASGAGEALQPTGSVKFTAPVIGTLCTAPVASATHTATCSYAFSSAIPSPGATVTATYVPGTDTNFPPGTIGSTTQIVMASGTTTSVASPVASPAVNQQVAFTATVMPNFTAGTAKPTGTVAFVTTTGTTLCSAQPLTNGIAPVCNASFGAPGSYTVVANYTSGDTNFSNCTSPAACASTVSETVIKATSSTSVVSTPNPSAVNQQVAFTATVTPQYPGATKPTGTASFVLVSTTATGPQAPAPGTVLCSGSPLAPAANGTVTATCANTATTFALQGTYTIVANYTGGDSNFSGCVSPSSCASVDAQSVGAGVTAVTLTSSPGPSSFVNESVTLNATINFASSGSSVPTGIVVYNDSTTPTPLCTFGSTGSPSTFTGGVVPACVVAFTSPGSHSLTATFTSSNTNNFLSSPASNAVPQSVSKDSTTVTVGSSPSNPSSANVEVTFTATVSPVHTAGSDQPTGTVTFTLTSTTAASPAPGTVLCSAASVATIANVTTATCANALTTFGTNGTYNITASYNGDPNFQTSVSALYPQSVGAGATSIKVTSFLTGVNPPVLNQPSTVNQSVTFNSAITFLSGGSTVPTGIVTYFDGAATLCAFGTVASPVTFTGGSVPACVVPLYSAGTHSITATFTSANSNFTSSTSPGLNQVVNPTATSVKVSGPQAVSVNQTISFTATVTPVIAPFNGSTNPTGTVTFTYSFAGGSTVTLCLNVPFGPGTESAVCSGSLPATGGYTITATYSGDANFVFSASNPYPVTVGTTPTTLTLSSSLPRSVASQEVVFTASIAPTFSAAASPTGTVTFNSSDGTLNAPCSNVPVAPLANGTSKAVCVATFPASEQFTSNGQVTVSATYNPNGNFVTSNGNFPQVVQNYGVAFSAPSASGTPPALVPVFLTQGKSNVNDPFDPQPITVSVMSSGGFDDSLKVTCVVASTTGQTLADAPSCSPSTSTLIGTSGTSLSFTVSASASTPVGSYSVQIVAKDSPISASNGGPTYSLVQSTLTPVVVYVVGVNGTVDLGGGATTADEDIVFDTATPPSGVAPTTLSSFACGVVKTSAGATVSSGEVSCLGPSGGVNVTGSQTVASIIIQGSTVSAQLRRSDSIYAAAFFGMPLIALIGWLGVGKSQRRNFFRFIGLILLIVGLSFGTGCGGSFSQTGETTTTLKIAKGNYLVQVVAKDQNGVSYYAVVPLTVNQ
jgi:hypothetical protein